MRLTVANSLRTAIDKLAGAPTADVSSNEQTINEIKPDTPCKHAACGARYSQTEQEQPSVCRYHAGVPIFHEGTQVNVVE